MELASIGATPKGGVKRLALTDLDKRGRDKVVSWAKAAGLSVSVDQIGNIFMRRQGTNPKLPPVMTGSHIDTQPTGGKFDGNYGVLAGLEVVRTLNELCIQTEAPIEVAIWTNEEGSRFVPVMMGSGVFCGAFTLDYAYSMKDTDGCSVRDELERIGYLGPDVCGNHPIGSYFEAHIEQGPVLEDADRVIGVVPAVLGLSWYDCVVTGVESHAGPTPMPLRRDALQAATVLMQEIVAIANRYAPGGRGTVGFVQVFPNSRNVIPGEVHFSIDLRNETAERLDKMHDELLGCISAVQASREVKISLERVSHFPPCPFDATCVSAVRTATERLGYSHMDVVSGAGHDAIYVARVAPATMIFVPCKNGISHNEIEDARADHLGAGCNVLLYAMLERAAVAK
ncbi:Zn-dependent hydrolase [Paraburkholderia sp. BCC1884]|uniref:Zn-dependent hydrolase n=1 Tax=Paraburkholderia sp. BCC1884 TaxID=2562668 RepID=UPI00118315AE|nr:Zn-dependent hydrolase [Paraburkholderia sp. BCC1884]